MEHELSFTAYDALTIAMNIETDGQEFYARAAELMPTPKMQKVMELLGQQEAEHRKTYEIMRDDVVSLWGKDMLPMDKEISGFLTIYSNGEVFNEQQKRALLDGPINVEGIIHFAIEAEYRNLAFLAAIREVVPEEMGKAWVSKIIKEEIGHIDQLGLILKSL